jgi:hypothetical protein
MRRTIVASVGGAVILAACSRSAAPPVDGGPGVERSADAGAIARGAVDGGATLEEAPPETFVEARRARLTKLDDEPGLAANAGAIRQHFGGTLPPLMDLQVVPLASGRQGLLLGEAADEPRPIVLLVDATGTALWTKERPLGGITPPARPFAMAPRPDGGLALFVYDEPTKLVAARMWAADGAAYAELMLFELAKCDAISAAWWPGRGWIVVTAFPGGARAQLLREAGSSAWDPSGMPVGEAWRAPATPTIVIDPATSSWVLVQHATRGARDHVVVVRYGPQGERIGTADLGAVGRVTRSADRIGATLARPGVVKVDLGKTAVEVLLDSVK